ncbi:MAG: hypothetical protein IPL79_03865 [Myxococcales bacterium]|nr:hypothetical protein [Myxococcales bacterium]
MCLNSNDPSRCRGFLAPSAHEEFDRCTATFVAGGQCVASHVAFADTGDAASGARLDTVLYQTKRGLLGGIVATTALPIRILTGLAGQPVDVVGGDLSLALTLAGTSRKPVAFGTIEIGRLWLLGAALGDASFKVHVSADDQLVVQGELLDGRLALTTTLGTRAPYELRSEVRFTRLDIDTILPPEMLAKLPLPMRMWGTGVAVIETNLGDDSTPSLQLDLSEARVIADFFDAEGRPTPLDLRSLSPFSLVVKDETFAIMCPSDATPSQLVPCDASFATPAGPLRMRGTLSEKHLDVAIVGRVDAGLLRPFFAAYVDAAGGYADLAITAVGSPSAPIIDAQLALDNAWVRLAGQDSVIRLPSGVIALRQDSVGFTGVKVVVQDDYTGDSSELSLLGNIMLKNYRPALWALDLEGEISGPVLVALAPETLSQASGVAKISATLFGAGEWPALFGQIEFDPRRPLALTPRAARSQLVMERGLIQVSDNFDPSQNDACDLGTRSGAARGARTYRIGLCALGGSFDNEGLIRNLNGIMDVDASGIIAANVQVLADAIPFRVPRTLDLVVNAKMDFVLRAASAAWDISGRIEMVSGKYISDFEFGELISPSSSNEPAEAPFWETSPSLGGARLNVAVDVRRFSIVNNLANIDMDGTVNVGGTPRTPQFSGEITVQRGTFRFPTWQATFTRTSGAVQFSPLRDLYTSTGFNKGQTAQLLIFGRTPDQFRRSLDGTTQTQTATDPSTNPSESFTDQLIKDASGDVVALFIEDPIRDFIKLDVARPVIGAGSVGFHGEKKFTDNINVIGDWQTGSTSQNFNIRGEVRSPYRVNLQIGYLSRRFDDATEDDVQNFELKLVYSLPLF